jgi:tRNA A37 methylthiotransferase MiaB
MRQRISGNVLKAQRFQAGWDFCQRHPDYSLYPELGDRALGFLTRGCPRRCPFCVVPVKEGTPRQVSDLATLLQDPYCPKIPTRAFSSGFEVIIAQ